MNWPPVTAVDAAYFRRKAPGKHWVQTEPVLMASTLLEVCAHLSGQGELQPCLPDPQALVSRAYPDLAEVRGRAQAKRALEIVPQGALTPAGRPPWHRKVHAGRALARPLAALIEPAA